MCRLEMIDPVHDDVYTCPVSSLDCSDSMYTSHGNWYTGAFLPLMMRVLIFSMPQEQSLPLETMLVNRKRKKKTRRSCMCVGWCFRRRFSHRENYIEKYEESILHPVLTHVNREGCFSEERVSNPFSTPLFFPFHQFFHHIFTILWL